MEIEFNPSRLSARRENTPVKHGAAPNDPRPPMQGVAERQRKLNDFALTRPNNMDAVRPLVWSVQYPPGELPNGITHLLSIHLNQ